jgi:DNA-binding NarL/FixJ family response regulator
MLKLVIIEDEFFAAEHLKDLVISLGHSVSAVFHSGEAFLVSTNCEYDAALVDIYLVGELTGLNIASELKKKNKPFIFLTANQDLKTLQKAAKLSPSSYLTKPFQNNDIAASLAIMEDSMNLLIERSYHSLLRENHLTSEPLTSREIDILKRLVDRETSAEISDALFISKNTVKYHTKNLYRKLNVNSRREISESVSAYLSA